MRRGKELLAQPYHLVPFTKNRAADRLLNNLSAYPHAFVIACLMDRQMPAEKAWLIPYLLKQKLGTFKFSHLEKLSLRQTRYLMEWPTPLHRFSPSMADVIYSAIQKIAGEYLSDASLIWRGKPSSATIVRRFLAFRGAGIKIATMAANILVREFKIPVSDKVSIDISPDVHVRRVFKRLGLIDPDATNEELIYRARELNPTYPGIFDLAAWEVGRYWCRPQTPLCEHCYMNKYCPTAERFKSQ